MEPCCPPWGCCPCGQQAPVSVDKKSVTLGFEINPPHLD